MSRRIHPAKREDDKRLRPGGRKEVVSIRLSPLARKMAKALLARTGEGLGEYIERLLLADLAKDATNPGEG